MSGRKMARNTATQRTQLHKFVDIYTLLAIHLELNVTLRQQISQNGDCRARRSENITHKKLKTKARGKTTFTLS
jgi:hypothetical protein